MGIDIQYLLFLQRIRQALGGSLDEVFNSFSKFAVGALVVLPIVIYWCASKDWGTRMYASFNLGCWTLDTLKLTVCAYRPWIRSELVEPAGDSKVAATGYSFPSGHTLISTTIYGTAAKSQKPYSKAVYRILIALILLTAFSRNFLGVHTPQDVIVGCAMGFGFIWLMGKPYDRIKDNTKVLDIATVIILVLVALSIAYVTLKPYPMDYVDGKLLVDPLKMMIDAYGSAGETAGMVIALYLDRHYIHYEVPKDSPHLAILTVFGVLIVLAWTNHFAGAIMTPLFGVHWGNFLSRLLRGLFAIGLYPMIIMKYAKQPLKTPLAVKEKEPVKAN